MKKTNPSKGKFFDGALMGAALGISALMIAQSKLGKKMNKDLRSKAEEFYKHLEPHLGDTPKLLGIKKVATKTKIKK